MQYVMTQNIINTFSVLYHTIRLPHCCLCAGCVSQLKLQITPHTNILWTEPFKSCNTAISEKCSRLCPWSEQFQEISVPGKLQTWYHAKLFKSQPSLKVVLTMNLKRLVSVLSPVHLKKEIHLLSFMVYPLQSGQTVPASHFSPEKS